MRSKSVSFATKEEREFWENSEYSVTHTRRELLELMNNSNFPITNFTTRALYEYIYNVCGVQPGECLVKRRNDSYMHSSYDVTVEIRFKDAYTLSLFKLGQ